MGAWAGQGGNRGARLSFLSLCPTQGALSTRCLLTLSRTLTSGGYCCAHFPDEQTDLPEVTGRHLACLESGLYLCVHHVPGRGTQAALFALHTAPPS